METVMTPLTNQKLVEALRRCKAVFKSQANYMFGIQDGQQAMSLSAEIVKIDKIIKEASAPQKEFPPGSGMTKNRWFSLCHFLKGVPGCDETDSEACRMIAEGLSE